MEFESLETYLTKSQIKTINNICYGVLTNPMYKIKYEDIEKLTIKFNPRLRTTAGKFKARKIGVSYIELNPKYLKEFSFDTVLKHFFTNWHILFNGLNVVIQVIMQNFKRFVLKLVGI